MRILVTGFSGWLFFHTAVIAQVKTTVPVELKNNRTYVTIETETRHIPHILLDTGFAYDGLMLFHPSFQDSMDMTGARRVQIGGAGSGPGTRAVMVDSVRLFLGNRDLQYHPVMILEEDAGFGSNGIIGYSLFGHFITEFDYDFRTLTLHASGFVPPDSGWAPIPLYFKSNQIPWVDVRVATEDEPPADLSVYIDFAAGDAIVLLDKPDKKFVMPRLSQEILIGRGLSGDITGKTGILSRLIIGPYTLNDVQAMVAPAAVRSKQENADAVLGNLALQRFNLIFDYEGRQLWIRPNSRFTEPL